MTAQSERLTGTVTWYSRKKGFGFVAPDQGSKDIFLHHTALPQDVDAPINTGDRITFTLGQSKKGPIATEISMLTDRVSPRSAPRPTASPMTDYTVDSTITRFADLPLGDDLLRAVQDAGYTEPTPIQAQAIPHVFNGRDLLGCAQTGTGKTAAFALPILQRLADTLPADAGQSRNGSKNGSRPDSRKKAAARPIRVLVLSPTRELAIQIGDSFSTYGRHTGLTNTVIFGGVKQGSQVQALKRGVDVLVATPGRLLDLMGQGVVKLDRVEVLVLDEADRMLDMGFIRDVRRIIKAVPTQRQTLLFSATLPAEIVELADNILINPLEVAIEPEQPTIEAIEQAVYFVPKKQKQALLEHVLHDSAVTRVLVFTRTKHGANKVVKRLTSAGINAEPIHGNKSQAARQSALKSFRDGSTRVLVATDVVARGIDVEDISHVIQFDLPNEPETYIHRIGRTGRAGAAGIAVSFCAADEQPYLRDIEKLIRMRVPVQQNHPFSA
ncbi:MAG: DEAD/DEAH box helicase [Anaerolineae bacterium]|nr:DEAD/DEAH box helicase [Anaerolineae bacterium]